MKTLWSVYFDNQIGNLKLLQKKLTRKMVSLVPC